MYVLIAVFQVVTASSPDPVPVQVSGPTGAGASTGTELAVSTRPRYGVHDTSSTNGVSEGSFPTG